MKYIIDRFEGDFAICEVEGKKMVDIEKKLIPAGAREGDVLTYENGTYAIDTADTREKSERIRRKMEGLWG